MGSKVNIKNSRKLIAGFTIPTRPTVMLEAIKAQNSFIQNPRKLTATILQDMTLAATVLQTANTLLASYNRKVSSIECAIVLLGQERLRNIIQELFMSSKMAGRNSPVQKVRIGAVRVAHIMSWLVQEIVTISPNYKNGTLPIVPADEAYVIGMFHDCGRLVLLNRFPDYPDLVTGLDKKIQTLEEAEMDRYQTNHALLGALLCDAWKLPKTLTQIIETHHHIDAFAVGKPIKERKFAVIHALLFLAEFIEEEIFEWEWKQGQDYFHQFFDIDASQVDLLQEKAKALFPPMEDEKTIMNSIVSVHPTSS